MDIAGVLSQSECQIPDVKRRDKDGYVILPGGISGTHIKAHRLAWALHNGADPAGLVILHTCDNPPCVNPEHLVVGTNRDNQMDKVRKGRQSRRDHGHGAQKLISVQVEAIVADTRRQCVIAAEYGVSHQLVSRLKDRWRVKKS